MHAADREGCLAIITAYQPCRVYHTAGHSHQLNLSGCVHTRGPRPFGSNRDSVNTLGPRIRVSQPAMKERSAKPILRLLQRLCGFAGIDCKTNHRRICAIIHTKGQLSWFSSNTFGWLCGTFDYSGGVQGKLIALFIIL